jgi:acyl-coenzyme A thioesterase PaaI-like protein
MRSLHYTLLPPLDLAETQVTRGLLQSGAILSHKVYKGEMGDVKAIIQLGEGLDGHDELIHGGVLALFIDDILGYGFTASEIKAMTVTANLNINFRVVVPAKSEITVYSNVVERKGRKIISEIQVVSSDGTVHCEATGISVIVRSKL